MGQGLDARKRKRLREETKCYVLLNKSLHRTYIDQRMSSFLDDDGGVRWDVNGENFPMKRRLVVEASELLLIFSEREQCSAILRMS